MRYQTHFEDEIKSFFLKRCLTSNRSLFMTVSTMAIKRKKSKCDKDCIFLCELFSFYEKLPGPLDPVGFFSKYFYLNPQPLVMF